MNKKTVWYIVPAAILPYLVLFSVVAILNSTKNAVFQNVMKWAFQGNALFLLTFVFFFALLASVLSIVCFVRSVDKQWPALSLAKTAMIVKLVQIPAHIASFILGVLMFLAIFTFPFTVGMFLTECLTLFLTGLITISAAVIAARQGRISKIMAVFYIVAQFIFVVDIISAVILFVKLADSKEEETIEM